MVQGLWVLVRQVVVSVVYSRPAAWESLRCRSPPSDGVDSSGEIRLACLVGGGTADMAEDGAGVAARLGDAVPDTSDSDKSTTCASFMPVARSIDGGLTTSSSS